jgi:hypothetical protein
MAGLTARLRRLDRAQVVRSTQELRSPLAMAFSPNEVSIVYDSLSCTKTSCAHSPSWSHYSVRRFYMVGQIVAINTCRFDCLVMSSIRHIYCVVFHHSICVTKGCGEDGIRQSDVGNGRHHVLSCNDGNNHYELYHFSYILSLAYQHVVVNFIRIIKAFIVYRNNPGGPVAYLTNLSSFLNIVGSAASIAQTILGDGFVVRCFMFAFCISHAQRNI